MLSVLTPAGHVYCKLAMELLRLRAEGADEATEDAHLDSMDGPWWALSEQDRVILEERLEKGEL